MSNQNAVYLTKERFAELQLELKELKTVKRREIAESLEYARSLGDLSENAEYHEARASQADLEKRIFEIEDAIKNAEIVNGHSKATVSLGSRVSIVKDGEKEPSVYQVVGREEADIASGKISNESPLGQAVLGKKVSDSFSVKTPQGVINYTVSKIE